MDVLNYADLVNQVVTGRGPVVDVFIYLSALSVHLLDSEQPIATARADI